MFPCANCTCLFMTIQEYNDHQKDHKNSLIKSIPCLNSNCKAVLSSYLSFRHHLLRFHRSNSHYKCKYNECSYTCSTLTLLRKHYASPSHPTTREIKCNYCQDSSKIFSNKNAYAVHVSRHHKNSRRISSNQSSNVGMSSYKVLSSSANNDTHAKPSDPNQLVVNKREIYKNRAISLKRSCSDMVDNSNDEPSLINEIPLKITKFRSGDEVGMYNLQDSLSRNNDSVLSTLNPLNSNSASSFKNNVNDSCYIDLKENNIASNLSRTGVIYIENGVINKSDMSIQKCTINKINITNNHVDFLEDEDHDETGLTENSLIVNSLNWEIESYISNKNKETPVPTLTQNLAKIYINLSVKHFATEPVLDGVITGMYSAFDLCKKSFVESVSESCLPDDTKVSVTKIFESSFQPFINTHNPKTGILRNTYNRKQYNKELLNYIEPIEVSILDDEGKETSDTYSYVPLLETVKVWLNNENVRPFCTKPRNSVTRHGLFDVKDGNIMKKDDFFNKNNTVQIAFFQDAFELCNPIGAAKSKFKMVGLYLMILNVPPFLRSKTDNIKLVLLCKNKYVTKWRWSKILSLFIRDLRILESKGVTIIVDSKPVTFTGSVVVGIGDNLGNHSIGGFAENFGSVGYVCRFCEMILNEFRANPFDRKPLRTISSYNECATKAVNSKKLVKGIKSNSVLNELQHFHVAGPGLAPCIAHDLFEGIVPYDLYMAIMYFVKKKWFRLGLLNYRLNSIKLSNETQKFIPNIKKDAKNKRLTGTASQMKRLLMILPIAIYDRIPDASDEVWRMILYLRELCCIACAPALSHDQIMALQNVTQKYINLRVQKFQEPLRPKHDYIIHFPELMYAFGPLKHLWTLRFEAKHSYFRSIAESSRNFKNIHMTLAEKHELLQASLENQYEITVVSKDATLYDPKNCEKEVSSLIDENFKNKTVYVSKKVTFCGIDYSENMAVCIGKNTFGNFVICTIKYILINKNYNYIYFIGWTDEIIPYEELGIYEIARYKGLENRSRWFGIFPYAYLLSPDPLPKYFLQLQSSPIYLMKYVPFNPMDY